MMIYEPKPNEQTFSIRPIGVKYICEYCGEGEMKFINDDFFAIMSSTDSNPSMRKHRCDKCNGELFLPKVYPYIEWIID